MVRRVALVTGASRGIGAAISLALGLSGIKVYGTATSAAGATKITKFFEERCIEGSGVVLDITDVSSIEKLKALMNDHDANPDILINNAGITKDNLIMRMKADEWANVIDTNLNAVFNLSKTFLRHMVKNRWGRIVNISSISGSIGNAGQTNYSASKAGLEGFSRSLAMELSTRNITVNIVSPGFIATDMTKNIPSSRQEIMLKRIPLARFGSPEEVASTVNFLVTEAGNYITGENIHVNGGMYMA